MGSFLFDILEIVILVLFLKAMARSLGPVFRSPRIHVKTWGNVPPASSPSAPHTGAMVRDPVCGIFVSTELPHRLGQGKDALHFCSRECLEKFQKDAQHVAS